MDDSALSRLWHEVLEEPAGDDADFFAQGGTSLLAALLITRARGELGAAVTLDEFVQDPRYARLRDTLPDQAPEPTEPPLPHPLPGDLIAAVLDRLGVRPGPVPDLAGLTDLYRQWCRRVPFDNIRTLIHAAGGQPGAAPGFPAARFFADWLDSGTGGMCATAAVALHALVSAAGYDAMLVMAGIGSETEPNHITVAVTLAGQRYLLDTFHLGEKPLPLEVGTVPGMAPAHAVTIERRGLAWRLTYPGALRRRYHTCVLMRADPPAKQVADVCLGRPPIRPLPGFDKTVFARINTANEVITVMGGAVIRTQLDGESTFPDQVPPAVVLEKEFGISAEQVEKLTAVLPRLRGSAVRD
jgi:hypothetical protein